MRVDHTGYRADIDGLRALAVLAVVLFHADMGLPGGYVGVDVFFVISGYLITRLIAADLDRGTFSLADFWNRRLRRIWPAALAVTGVVLVAGWLIMLPYDLRLLGGDALAQVTMLANVRYWKGTDYFNASVDLRPLLHTWSLAVEEQFYVLFPLVMMGLWRFDRRLRIGMLAVVALASLLASVLCIGPRPMAVFYLLPFRAWEMLCGSLAALMARPAWLGTPSRHALSLIGIGAILAPCFTYCRETVFPGAAALAPCLGTVAIIAAGETACVNRFLSVEPLRRVGLASYSIYLWHWPILAFLRYVLGLTLTMPVTLMALAATVVAAIASYGWIETPLRRGWPARFPGRFAVVLAALSALIGGSALALWKFQGFPGRLTPEARRLLAGEQFPHRFKFKGTMNEDAGRHLEPIGEPTSEQGICFLLWGDSHANCVSGAIDDFAREGRVSGYAAVYDGFGPLPLVERSSGEGRHQWKSWQHGLVRWIQEHRPRHVILVARWSMYSGVSYADAGWRANMIRPSREDGGADPRPSGADAGREAVTAMRRGLDSLLRECEAIGSTVWFVLEVPYQPVAARSGVVAVQWFGGEPSFRGVDRATHSRSVERVREALAGCESKSLRVIDLAEPLFDASGVSRVGGEGRFWYLDSNHVNEAATHGVLAPLIRRMMAEIAEDCVGSVASPGD